MKIRIVFTPGYGVGGRVGLVIDWEGHKGTFWSIRNLLYLNPGINILQAVHLLFVHYLRCYMSMKRKVSLAFGLPNRFSPVPAWCYVFHGL